MKSPMHAMEDIITSHKMTHSPRTKELLKMSVAVLIGAEEKMIREAYEAGRNEMQGVNPEVSERKSQEYYNKKFK